MRVDSDMSEGGCPRGAPVAILIGNDFSAGAGARAQGLEFWRLLWN